jgi:acylphosphatase
MKRIPDRAPVNRETEKTRTPSTKWTVFPDTDRSTPLYNCGVQRERIAFGGRVQGVGFRATTRHLAHRHGLVGWVRNEPDGSVAMEVEGSDGAIAAFLADLRAHFVRHIHTESREPLATLGEEAAFVIRR